MASEVSRIAPGSPAATIAHIEGKLSLETDCSDVHAALAGGASDFVLLDVRSRELYERGHVPGALHLPRGKMTPRKMAEWPAGTLFVTYCAGPHCNGADKAALVLAGLGLAVKIMIGGAAGWADEGFPFAGGGEPGSLQTRGTENGR